MKDISKNVTVDHPLISIDERSKRRFVVGSSRELSATGHDFKQQNIIRAAPRISANEYHLHDTNLLIFSVIAVVNDACMLTKRAVCPDAVRLNCVLDDRLIVNSHVGVCELRCVQVKKSLVDADSRNVK